MDTPPFIHRATISGDWVDYNGHMNVAYYVLIFDQATDVFLANVGIDETYRQKTGRSVFVVESHIIYTRELLENAEVKISTQIINVDAKRLHLFHTMCQSDTNQPASTIEIMILHMDLQSRKSVTFPEPMIKHLRKIREHHANFSVPRQVGRQVGFE